MTSTVAASGDARTVRSGGAELQVQERGRGEGRPTVVLVHGWPDSHHVWNLVAERLEADHHVVTFDGRGVGGSTRAPGRRAYALDKLADDVAAVIDAVSPGRPVHLVGHDWGAVQSWELVTRPDAPQRVRSFTSVSGPSLDVLGAAVRSRVRQPSLTSLAPVASQGLRSAYTLVLSAQVVRTMLWRLGFERAFRLWLRVSEGIDPASGYPPPDVARNAVAAVPIYRTNIFGRLRRPEPRPAAVPVQVVVNRRDRYVSPTLAADVAPWVPDLTVHELDAGHWSPRTHPDALAALIADHVARTA